MLRVVCPVFLKKYCDVFYVVGDRLIDVIKISLSTGVVPYKWKESVVIPVTKIQSTKEYNEFRPINTVEIYEKVLELAVKKQLQDHCKNNNILVDNRSGFRERHSWKTIVIKI